MAAERPVRIDGLDQPEEIYKPIGVKSNIIQLFRRSREAEFSQIPLLVAGPDGTAINT
jgi:hypothetical protein